MRIWKAKASEKLGVITARERAAIEYRESLKERWKVDSEVNRVTRLVLCSFGPYVHLLFFLKKNNNSVYTALVISQNQSTKLQNSNARCWKPNVSKRREEESIHGREKPSPNRRGRSWSSWSRLKILLLWKVFSQFCCVVGVRWRYVYLGFFGSLDEKVLYIIVDGKSENSVPYFFQKKGYNDCSCKVSPLR